MALTAGVPLIPRLYGAAYAAATPAYAWLMVAQAAFFVTHMNYMFLYARGRSTTVWWLSLATLAMNGALNLALIPLLGPAGAGLAALATEATMVALQLVIISRIMRAGCPSIDWRRCRTAELAA